MATSAASNRRGSVSKREPKAEEPKDPMRALVELEGREARNLLVLSVNLDRDEVFDEQGEFVLVENKTTKRKKEQDKRQKQKDAEAKKRKEATRANSNSKGSGKAGSAGAASSTSTTAAPRTVPSVKVSIPSAFVPPSLSSSPKDTSRVLGGRGDKKAKVWSYLFDSLHGVIDEIYSFCEADIHEIECREVIMILNHAKHDFEALINRSKVESQVEDALAHSQPLSVSWEIRKASQGAGHSFVSQAHHHSMMSHAASESSMKSFTSMSSMHGVRPVATWADHVRGKKPEQKMKGKGKSPSSSKSNLASQPESQEEELTDSSKSVASARTVTTQPLTSDVIGRVERKESTVTITNDDSNSVGEQVEEYILSPVNSDEDVASVSSVEYDDIDSPEVMPADWNDTPVSWMDVPAGMPWDEIDDWMMGRSPGGGALLHQKLSSPSRKRKPTEESFRKAQEKQERAKHNREERQKELTSKLRQRHETQREAVQLRRKEKEDRIQQDIVDRQQRAEELRESQLQEKRKKAQVEEVKKKEIMFIQRLENANNKMELEEKNEKVEERKEQIISERQRKRAENDARKQAAEARRQNMLKEEEARMQALAEKLQSKQSRAQSKREQSIEAKKTTARADIDQRLEELQLARSITATPESSRPGTADRSHDVGLSGGLSGLVQAATSSSAQNSGSSALNTSGGAGYSRSGQLLAALNASSSGGQSLVADGHFERDKFCTLCHTTLPTEASLIAHMKSREHTSASSQARAGNVACIVDAPSSTTLDVTLQTERFATYKKRLKKLTQRLTLASSDVTGKSLSAKVSKAVTDVTSAVASMQNGKIVKALTALQLCTPNKFEQSATFAPDCNAIVAAAVSVARVFEGENFHSQQKITTTLPLLDLAVKIYDQCIRAVAASQSEEALAAIISHGYFTPLVDLLTKLWDAKVQTPAIQDLCSRLCHSLSLVVVTERYLVRDFKGDHASHRLLDDAVKYIVCMGVIEKIHEFFSHIHGTLEDNALAHLAKESINLVFVLLSSQPSPLGDDQLSVFRTLEETAFAGIISLLYSVVLYPSSAYGARVSDVTLDIVTLILKVLNFIAMVNIGVFQRVIGDEILSLEFVHAASRLFGLEQQPHGTLIDELVVCIGYFALGNFSNQERLRNNLSIALIPALAGLPFEYFNEPKHMAILLPTLLAITFENEVNTTQLKDLISLRILTDYITEHLGRKDKAFAGRDAKRFPAELWAKAVEFYSQQS